MTGLGTLAQWTLPSNDKKIDGFNRSSHQSSSKTVLDVQPAGAGCGSFFMTTLWIPDTDGQGVIQFQGIDRVGLIDIRKIQPRLHQTGDLNLAG
jgi:hypothetical protein